MMTDSDDAARFSKGLRNRFFCIETDTGQGNGTSVVCEGVASDDSLRRFPYPKRAGWPARAE